MRDQPIDIPFPFKGLDEYRSFADQPGATTPDLLNVMGVDPATGRLRGAQRPGLSRYADESVTYTPVQDIIHMIGPDFGPAGGASQQMVNNPVGASWGLLNRSGTLYQKGGAEATVLYQMGCWDSLGYFYVATRATTTDDEIIIDRYDVNGQLVGFLDPTVTTTLTSPIGRYDSTIRFEDSTAFPAVPFYIKVDSEYMYVSAATSSVWTVVRAPVGTELSGATENTGTTAATHANGATIQLAKRLSVFTGNFSSSANPVAGMLVSGATLYVLVNGKNFHQGLVAPYTNHTNNITSVNTSTKQITKAGFAWPKTAVGSELKYQGTTGLVTAEVTQRTSDTVLTLDAAPALGAFTTTLAEGGELSAGDATITVTDGSVFDDVLRPFTIKIDLEEIRVVSIAGNDLTVTGGRGANGTSAVPHDDGSNVTFVADNWTLTAPTDADPRHMIARYQTATGVCIDGGREAQPIPFAQSSTVKGSGLAGGQFDGTLFTGNYNYLASVNQYLAVPTEDPLIGKVYDQADETGQVVIEAGSPTKVRLESSDSTSPVWPNWIADAARTAITIQIPNGDATYTIASRDSDTQITLTGSAEATAGATFNTTAINRKRFLLNIIDIGSGTRYSSPTNSSPIVLEANDAAVTADSLLCTGIQDDGVDSFFVAGQTTDASGGPSYKNFVHYRIYTGLAADAGWALAGKTDTSLDGFPTGIAYSAYNDHLAVAGPNIFNTDKSFAVYQGNSISGVDGGDELHKSDPLDDTNGTAVTQWDRVFADAEGNYRLTRNASGKNIVSIVSPSHATNVPTILWAYDAGDNDQAAPIDINTVHRGRFTATQRSTRLLFVRGGDVYRVDTDEGVGKSPTKATQTLNTGDITPFNSATPRIFSAEIYPNVFFVDGGISTVAAGSYYYDSSTDTVSSWVGSPGTFPVDSNGYRPSLICAWQARIVMSGLVGDPHNWFMSAINDPFNFDYAPATVIETMAVAGSSSNAGKTQDIITALVPWSNDLLLFGMDHSLAQMSGNPAAGGRFDTLTDVTGMAYGRPFSMHPDRSLWFIGSRGGLYRLTPGQGNPERISSTTIDERLSSIDFSRTIVRMQWDDRLQGFLIIFTDTEGGESTHYFFDIRNMAWYPWKFGATALNPHSIYLFDGDKLEDRVVLAGGQDGILRVLDYMAKSDDKLDNGNTAQAYAINSHVLLGPIQGPSHIPVVITGLSSVLGTNSDKVTYSIHPGDSPQEAVSAPAIGGGTFGGGRNTWDRRRTSGTALYIKLSNTTKEEAWAMERVYATLRGTGRTFEKAH